MKISYKPLQANLVEHNMMKKDLMKAASLTSNHIANMGKGQHISMSTLIRICEALYCDIKDVIELAPE
jgi:DNA-binding Xre family transcriptional regulator